MGWSIDLLDDDIKGIFAGVKYEIIMPEAVRPYVHFNYEGDSLNRIKKQKLAALFPPDVYLFFHPNTKFDEASVIPEVPSFPTGLPGEHTEPVEHDVAPIGEETHFPGAK